MPRKKIAQSKTPELTETSVQPVDWLKGVYHFHVFHYRMPQTAAISAVTPFVPSPLTVKLAMVAALLQLGKHTEAEILTRLLPKIEVHIAPSVAAFSFKAFLRYCSVPAVESAGEMDKSSGSFYPSRPHTREYSLFQGDLVIFLGIPQEAKSVALDALKNIRYLGCKDSLVWCKEIESINQSEIQLIVQPLKEQQPGAVVLLADVKQDATMELRKIIPGHRKEDYRLEPYTLPGNITTIGRTKLFRM